jgi:hypothetical protein
VPPGERRLELAPAAELRRAVAGQPAGGRHRPARRRRALGARALLGAGARARRSRSPTRRSACPGRRRPTARCQRALARMGRPRRGAALPLPHARARTRRSRACASRRSARGVVARRAGGPRAATTRRRRFGAVRKLEHPGFLVPLLDALERVRPPDGGGCWCSAATAATRSRRSAGSSRRRRARRRRRRSRGRRARAGAVALPRRAVRRGTTSTSCPPSSGRFHLAIAIDVLQSPAVDDKRCCASWCSATSWPVPALLLGLPNSRFRGGEVVWGARTRNYREPATCRWWCATSPRTAATCSSTASSRTSAGATTCCSPPAGARRASRGGADGSGAPRPLGRGGGARGVTATPRARPCRGRAARRSGTRTPGSPPPPAPPRRTAAGSR